MTTSTNHRRAIVEQYYDSPRLKWVKQLGNGRVYDDISLRRGNGIATSADSNYLFITSDDGKLHIMHAHHPKIKMFERVFNPELAEQENNGWLTFCHSSVSLHHSDDRIPRVVYAVYAVVDTPPPNSELQEKSRVIAVDHKANEIWSTELPGVAVGTPVISKNGQLVYITHNTADETVGYFTALNAYKNGTVVTTESNSKNKPYSQITMVHNSGEDILYFGETPDRGYDYMGVIHKVVRRNGVFVKSIVPYARWSTATAPTVSRNGDKVWASGRDAWIRGIKTDPSESRPVMWSTALDVSLRNRTQPLYNRAALSSDDQFLYVASSGASFNCLHAETGKIIWKTSSNDTSIYLTEAKVSDDDLKVFTIRHNDGTVTQQDATTGRIDWSIDCTAFSPDPYCQDSVEAEFTISSDGGTIYYGDIFGKIVALTIGRTPEPTPFPSESPTVSTRPSTSPTSSPTGSVRPTSSPSMLPTSLPTSEPSSMPSDEPSLSPTEYPTVIPTVVPTWTSAPSSSPSSRPSSSPSLGIVYSKGVFGDKTNVVFLGLAAVFVVCFVTLCFMFMKKAKTKRSS